MTEILIYQGKAAIALVAFYIFYRLMLSKETLHRFNRIVLLGTAAMAFILPLCVITINRTVILPAVNPVETVVEAMEVIAAGTTEAYHEPILPAILLCIFMIGALTVMLMTVISIIKVKKIIDSGEHHILDSSEILVITENGTAPFSWMKYIVLSREDYESGYSQILTHEKAHIALRHSWDLLFVDLITVIQWFNPVIWMLKSDLRALHEFEADDAVLRSGADIKEYQYLLIKKAVSKSGYSVANSFNHSTLKQRITMMLNKKSSRMSAWKALYVLPLVGIFLAATAETKVDYQYEGQQHEAVVDTLDAKVSEISDTLPKFPQPKNPFTLKNLREGHFIVDKENNIVTLRYFGEKCQELEVQYTGLDLNKNIYILNGVITTQEICMNAAKEDPDAVVIVAYLSGENRVSATITTSGVYVTGKIQITKEEESKPDITIKGRDGKGQDFEVVSSDLVYVVNGERMPADYDLNSIAPETITSMEVLKTEAALKEYGTTNGVIKMTVDPSKKGQKIPTPNIYIDGKKATSEEVAALPPNPKGHIAEDGSVWITTEEGADEKVIPLEVKK